MPDVLEIRDLSVSYAASRVLESVDLTVAEGEVLALLGPSGSGKSTLLNAIAGFLPVQAGTILLGGRRVATPGRADPPERRDIAFVFQDYGLWPHLNAARHRRVPAAPPWRTPRRCPVAGARHPRPARYR